MKKSSPAELRKLRVRAKELEAQQNDPEAKFEKKLGTHETPERKRLKVWVTWFIAFAFVVTSVGFIMGSSASSKQAKQQQAQEQSKGRPDTTEEQNQKELQANLEFFTKQVAEDPKNTQSLCNLGATYFQIGNNEKAIENYKKALEIDPKDSYAMKHLAEIYAKEKKYTEAKELLLKAVVLSDKTEQDEYYAFISGIDFTQNNVDGAIDNMKKAIEIEAKPEYYGNLSEYYMKKGKNEEAIKAIESGVEIAKAMNDPGSIAYLDMLKDKMKKAVLAPNAKTTPGAKEQPQPNTTPGTVKIENPGQPAAPQGQSPVQPGQPEGNQPGTNPPAGNAPVPAPAQPAPGGNPPEAPQGNQPPAAPPAQPQPGNNTIPQPGNN
jgi:tetratricopeptide (TPR) repeat protein